MSSTSSSECMCNECLNYAAYRSPSYRTRAPYYQTLGHPMVYYARVMNEPSINFQQRPKESRKGGPNCFVKAFRWYTREHYPPRTDDLPSDRTDLAGFAVWLDKKYDQFILEKNAEQQEYLQSEETAPLDAKHNDVHLVCEHIKKPFSRLKSPFKKWRRPTAAPPDFKSGGDIQKCTRSCEYLLKPKDLSQPTSEQNPSNVSVTSKKTIVHMTAHSSEINTEKANSTPIETVKIDVEQPPVEAPTKNRDFKSIEYKKPETNKSNVTKSSNNHICECPEVPTVEEETQCDVEKKVLVESQPITYNCCPNCVLRSNTRNIPEPIEKSEVVAKHNSILKRNSKKDSMQTCSGVCQHPGTPGTITERMTDEQERWVDECYCDEDADLKPSEMCRPPHADTEIFKNVSCKQQTITTETAAAQTSDHSIRFESGGYPLFMKIVCADKLHDELTRR